MHAWSPHWVKCDQQTRSLAITRLGWGVEGSGEEWGGEECLQRGWISDLTQDLILDSQVIEICLTDWEALYWASLENGVLVIPVWGFSGHRDGPWQIIALQHSLLATAGKVVLAKIFMSFGNIPKKTVKIAFCTNSPNHDMSTYDLGLVVLLAKQYIKSTYRNRLNK